MATPGAPDAGAERPVRLGKAVGIAALVGLPWALLFGAWENSARMAKDRFGSETMSLAQAALGGAQTAFWNAVVVCAFLALVGACMWLAVRSRGARPSVAGVAGVASAAVSMLIAHIVIQELSGDSPEGEDVAGLARLWKIAGWLVSTLAGVGIGAIVYRLVARRAKPLRLLALAVVAGIGLFAWSTHAAWQVNEKRSARAPKPSQTRPPAGAPNVVVIVMDAARADALHCYGYHRETSPNLDRLAQESALYERAYTTATWTLPTHSSLFTGKYLSEHGTHGEYMYLEDEHVTIAELLQEHGYQTLCVSANGNIGHSYNTVQGFERASTNVYGRRQGDSFLVRQLGRLLGKADYGARDGNQIAMRWVGEAVEAKRPFFLFMNYMEVHAKYGSTPYAARWIPDAKTFKRALKIPQDTIAYAAGVKSATPEEFALLRALYDGDVLYLDERVGQIIDFLRAKGVLDNTLLIVTSDHGEELGEHGLVGHSRSIYNTVFQIPLIVRYPKAFAPGSRHKNVVEIIDFFPTILDVTGISWEGRASLKGHSLLDKEAASKTRYAITEKFLPGAWAT